MARRPPRMNPAPAIARKNPSTGPGRAGASATSAAAFVSLLLGAAACKKADPPPPPAPSGVLAEVDGRPVTEASFRHWWDKRPRTSDDEAARDALLEQLVDRTIVANRARELGLADDPVVIENLESLLIARLKEKELFPQIKAIEVTEADARAAYEASAGERFQVPGTVEVAVLWFNTRGVEQLEERYRPRLEAVREKLESGGTGDATPVEPPGAEGPGGFGPLAITHSEHHATRFKGGVLTPLRVGADYDPWRAAVMEIASGLGSEGALSPVVSGPQGTFLVKLLKRTAARRRDFEAVKGTLVRELTRSRREALEEAFSQKLRAAARVVRHPDNLAEIDDLKVHGAPSPGSRGVPSLPQLSVARPDGGSTPGPAADGP